MSGECRRCRERGQTWDGYAPECAFTKTFFSPTNWNCATMNGLRNLAEERDVWNEDEHAAILPIPDSGEFLVMRWYKHRGRTNVAAVLNSEGEFTALDVCEAEHVLDRVAMIDNDGYWLTHDEAPA